MGDALMTEAAPKVAEFESLQCVAGPLCGKVFKIKKSARGLALNAAMIARLKREAKTNGVKVFIQGFYLKETWRRGKVVLLWHEVPVPRPFGRAG